MIKSLTSLRGIFILFIFFHHCLDVYPGGGTMAVAFFFVLGGFSMTLGYLDRVLKSDFSYKQYIARRCIKFYPLHWICLLAALPLVISTCTWKHIPIFFINASLLHTWFPFSWIYSQFNSVSWYLADTMFFSVVFPFLLKMLIKTNIKVKLCLFLLFAIFYSLIASILPVEWYRSILYISPYIRFTDFVFGVLLGLLYIKLRERSEKFLLSNNLSSIMVLLLIGMLVIESCLLSRESRFIAPLYWPLIAVLILTTSLSYERNGSGLLDNKCLQRLGELSFVFFMIHQLVLRYTSLLFEDKLHFENDYFYIAFTLIFTIFLSVIVDKYFLKPITKWLNKRTQPSMTAHS